jgi:hypothetical protein
LYDNDLQANIDGALEVARNTRRCGLSSYESDVVAILGGLPGTNGVDLLRATRGIRVFGFDDLLRLPLALGGTFLGSRIVGSILTVEEAYARLAALADPASPEPIAFHDVRQFCPARAHLMIEQLRHLGLTPQKAWAISLDPMMADPANDPLQLRPVHRDGFPLTDAQGQVIWPNHVAPVVEVLRPHGSTGFCVLDPSLVRGPAALDEWHARVDPRSGHSRQVTPLGVAPVDPATGLVFPGTGFHASTHPQPADPTVFSRARMTTSFQRIAFQRVQWYDAHF